MELRERNVRIRQFNVPATNSQAAIALDSRVNNLS